jgi:hypothetical protein
VGVAVAAAAVAIAVLRYATQASTPVSKPVLKASGGAIAPAMGPSYRRSSDIVQGNAKTETRTTMWSEANDS